MLLLGGVFVVGAFRIALTKKLHVTWRWIASEPASSKEDMRKWHLATEKGWANIWPAVVGYLIVGGSLVYMAASDMWEFYINHPDPEARLWMMPGIVLALVTLGYLQYAPRIRLR